MTATHSISRRWARALSLTGALVALAGAAAPAAAEPQYNNGDYVSLYATSPVTGLRHAATSWFAGYLGETADPAFPRVGDVFYIRGIVANTSGSLTDAPIMSFVFDERFDPDVEYAISAETPVQCLFYPDINEAGQPDPEHCRQTARAGVRRGRQLLRRRPRAAARRGLRGARPGPRERAEERPGRRRRGALRRARPSPATARDSPCSRWS